MKLVLVVGVERRAYKCQDCARHRRAPPHGADKRELFQQ